MMDKLPPNARAFLDSLAHSDDPTAAERARADAALRDALRERGLHDLPALPALPPAAASGSSALGLKLGLIGLSILGAGALAIIMLRPSPSPSPSPSPVPAPIIATPSPTPAEPEPEPEPAPIQRAPLRTRARAVPQARPVRASQNDDALQRELRVVAAANELLRQGRYADTLQLLDRSERDLVTHALHEERRALHILAQCGRAPDERALRDSEQFLRSAPQAVLATRVREACSKTP